MHALVVSCRRHTVLQAGATYQMVIGTASVHAIEKCSIIVSSEAWMRVPAAARLSPEKAAEHAAASTAAGSQRLMHAWPAVGGVLT